METNNMSSLENDAIRKEVEKILKYFNQKNYEKSEELAITFNQKYPKNIFIRKILAEIFSITGRKIESINVYHEVIQINSSDTESYYCLAKVLSDVGKFNEAKLNYEKAIILSPDHAKAYNNLGSIFRKLGNLKEAEKNYKKALILNPNYSLAYNNLAVIQQEAGNFKDSEKNYLKAIEIDPKLKELRFNLAVMLYSNHDYKKAIEHFKLIKSAESDFYLLRCAYFLGEKATFFYLLNNLIKKGENSAVIGSLVARSAIRYGIETFNPFCSKPLNYVFKTSLNERYDFKKIFGKSINTILENNKISFRDQKLLTNGQQTSNDFFDQEGDDINEIKQIINSEIKNYRNNFKNSDEGFIKNWPKSYKLTGWIVNMKSGGSLSSHMHDLGWLSGSIYINVPGKLKNNEGNLVVSTDYEETDKNFTPKSNMPSTSLNKNKRQEKIIDVVTGDTCIFPSSLLHHTIPFNAPEERIVLAFDVIKIS